MSRNPFLSFQPLPPVCPIKKRASQGFFFIGFSSIFPSAAWPALFWPDRQRPSAGNIRATLYGAVLRPLDLINAARQRGILDKCLIHRINQQHCLPFQRIVHPRFQLYPCVHRAGRVVRRAQVDEIRLQPLVRQRRKPIALPGVCLYDAPARHNVEKKALLPYRMKINLFPFLCRERSNLLFSRFFAAFI